MSRKVAGVLAVVTRQRPHKSACAGNEERSPSHLEPGEDPGLSGSLEPLEVSDGL